MAEAIKAQVSVPQLRTQHPAALGAPAPGAAWYDTALQRTMQVFSWTCWSLPQVYYINPPMSPSYSKKDYLVWYPHCMPPLRCQKTEVPAPAHLPSVELQGHVPFLRGDDGDNVVQYIVDHWKCILTFVSGIIYLCHIRKSLNGTVLERNNCLPIKMNTDVWLRRHGIYIIFSYHINRVAV